jgi:hypothetical protein
LVETVALAEMVLVFQAVAAVLADIQVTAEQGRGGL